jgi:hydrogenase expression/formation protein HypD
LFGKECTPERPIGALMVSSEGSCAAYYNYEFRKQHVKECEAAPLSTTL